MGLYSMSVLMGLIMAVVITYHWYFSRQLMGVSSLLIIEQIKPIGPI